MRNAITIKITILSLLVFGFWSLACCSVAHASIILRIMGVNPNEKISQTVELKAYLPEEVEPGDIIEKDDLEVIYDTQKGAYYVYGEYLLKPEQSILREIEIKDIWVIPTDELEGMRLDAVGTADLMENTQFSERANFLEEGISRKLDDITRRQEVVAVDPQKHISVYRRNMDMMESVKTDLILLKSLFGQSKPLPSITIWKVFLSIIVFLSFVSFTLFLFWYKRAKIFKNISGGGKSSSLEGKRSVSQEEEKKISASDIEEMLDEDK